MPEDKDPKNKELEQENTDSSVCDQGHDKEEKEHCYYKGGPMIHELFSHLPFSVLSVTLGIIAAGLICFLTTDALLETTSEYVSNSGGLCSAHCADDHSGHNHAEGEECDGNHGPSPIGFILLFHLFHPAHILFSAIATTAMFYKYEKSLIKAVVIGFTGSIVICTISDALIPTITTKMMGYSSKIHLCILDTPMQVIPFAVIGVLLGLAAVISGTLKSTISSHSIHVVASTMASLFYVIAHTGKLVWINQIGIVFLMTVVAVGGICCLSDVVLPLLFTKKARKEYALHGHDHPH